MQSPPEVISPLPFHVHYLPTECHTCQTHITIMSSPFQPPPTTDRGHEWVRILSFLPLPKFKLFRIFLEDRKKSTKTVGNPTASTDRVSREWESSSASASGSQGQNQSEKDSVSTFPRSAPFTSLRSTSQEVVSVFPDSQDRTNERTNERDNEITRQRRNHGSHCR